MTNSKVHRRAPFAPAATLEERLEPDTVVKQLDDTASVVSVFSILAVLALIILGVEQMRVVAPGNLIGINTLAATMIALAVGTVAVSAMWFIRMARGMAALVRLAAMNQPDAPERSEDGSP